MTISEKNHDFVLVRDAALEQKWKVERTKGNHWMFKAPDGKTAIVAGGAYGDPRAIKNLVARMRRAGFVPPKSVR